MRSSSLTASILFGALLWLLGSDAAQAQTPLVCGSDTVATIAVNGEVDTYSFAGVAGDVVSVAVGESVVDSFFEPCWQLFAPGGAVVTARLCAVGATTGTVVQVVSLPVTGTFTIEVSEAEGTRTGTYEINWHGLGGGNNCGTAATLCGDIAGAATPGGDLDTFSFAGVAGQVVAVGIGESVIDSAFEPCWQLFAPNGAQVTGRVCATSVAGGVEGTPTQILTLPATGTYTALISEEEADFRNGSYQFNVHGLSSSNACGTAPAFCGDIAAQVTPGGDVDTFSFNGVAGEVVALGVGQSAADSFFQPCWQLFAPNGSPLAARACGVSTAGTVTQVLTLPVSGTYTVLVNEEDADFRAGDFQLNVHGLSGSNACGAATPFCSDIVSANIPAGDVDTYSFSGSTAEVVAIGLGETVADGFYEPCWQLFAPNGAQVTARVCSGPSTAGTVAQVVTLPSNGTYTLAITEAQADFRNGSYELNVNGLSASNGCGAATPLCSTLASTSAPGGDIDTYSLPGTAGDVVSIAIGETSADNAFEPCWQIFAPDGSALNAQTCTPGGTAPQAITLPVNGDYQIMLTETHGDWRAGGMQLEVQGLSANRSCGPLVGCGFDEVATIADFGDIDSYRIVGNANEVVSISIGEPVADNFLNLCGQLFDSSGVSVGARTCATLNTTLRLLRTLPSAGTFTLEVSEQQADRTGSYAYSLQRILPTAQQCGQSTACGAPALGGVAQRVGDTKTYAFLAGAGDVVTINVAETFANASFTLCWQLFAPSGAAVGILQCGAVAATGVRTLTETGVHTIEVSEDALDTAWVYSVTVNGPLAAGVCTTPCGNGALDAGEACDDGSLGGIDCCTALCQVVPDTDSDTLCDRMDNCPTVQNLDQLDGADMDGVGQACDTCPLVANPRVTVAQRQIWMTLVSGQRDDDADGRGNRCDFDHDNSGPAIIANDFNQGKASVGDLTAGSTCGTGGTTPCGRFDQDEAGPAITNTDFNLLKAAVSSLVPARCGPACTPPFSGVIGKAPCEGPGC